ncbi:MAG: hypothetical protein OEM02_05605 [Desulfobulbaceae bacterium]|nr:hypothetical protein [Desulfobulbaceae bacterium]
MDDDGTLSASIGFLVMKATIKGKSKFSFSEKFLEDFGLIERSGRKWELMVIILFVQVSTELYIILKK